MSLFETRNYYKPFEYEWAYSFYKKSEQMHWLPDEVAFRDDIDDWNTKLSDEEKHLLTHLFRFFTQADIDVASGYTKIYLPKLGNHPELTMMMSSFAAREAIHIDAYSTLIETLGMPEDTYKLFTEYEEMKAKHEYVSEFKGDDPIELLKSLAVYSAFTEGMQLFSSFAILMNFERMNKMKGMCNIIRWSIKDESLHVEGMTKLFRELYDEVTGEMLWKDVEIIKQDIGIIAKTMVDLEDKFIDLCFSEGPIEGLTPEDLKKYIRFICNKRWEQLGFNGTLYPEVEENPLEWLNWVMNGEEHTNFFEGTPTGYSKGTVIDDDDDVVWEVKL